MRPLHYLEIENFKRFGDKQRIVLDHPAVLIGPNNCGKTTAIQAIALWSQAVKTWLNAKGNSSATKRTATALNRLEIVAVPVQSIRYFWHNTRVRAGAKNVPLLITLGVMHGNKVKPVTMRFQSQGDDLVYCTPDAATRKDMGLLEAAAKINVALLYPMSGLDTEEAILQPKRINALLGQGRTAEVLRNLCLQVSQNAPEDWHQVAELIRRLFAVDLGDPKETPLGNIELHYRQVGVQHPLEVALSGRGFQQMLLIFAYLFSHKGSVLLIDEPDAHLEILRQRQVYVLLKEVAAQNDSQVVMVTHSEVILHEASGTNLTLLLDGQADDLVAKTDIENALKHFGAEHYLRARERGYVLYVEGSTDIAMLRAMAERLAHPVVGAWDERINTYYTQNNFPDQELEAEIERVEGGFGITHEKHFHGLRRMVGNLRGLAILDSDGRGREDSEGGGLRTVYWQRYEAENYFVTPEVLMRFVVDQYSGMEASDGLSQQAEDILFGLIHERVFSGEQKDYEAWKKAEPEARRVIWEGKARQLKFSGFAEEFFRRLTDRLDYAMLLKKGDFHRLVEYMDPQHIPAEVGEKLDLLLDIFKAAKKHEETQEAE